MLKKMMICLAVVMLGVFCTSCTGTNDQSGGAKTELVVSAAASLTDVTKELAVEYAKLKPNVTLTFAYGASGSLQTQIEEGAPTDVFISAAKKQMDALAAKSLLDGSSKNLLVNKIVLITPQNSQSGITSFEGCAVDDVKTIALGDPATTPAGQYGKEAFESLGIWDKIKGKTNLGTDVRQVLTWVEMGQIDCGIVFKTDALSSDKVQIVAEAPANSHTLAVYPVGIIASSTNKMEAKAFVDFLSSNDAKTIFEKYGFSMAD